jgi:DNA-binding transcriptional MerR regulator
VEEDDDEVAAIGQVARRAGVGVETVRFYEREGLLEKPGRRASGYRQYGEGVVTRLRFIRRAKELALLKVTASCTGRGPTSACPILDALDKEASR